MSDETATDKPNLRLAMAKCAACEADVGGAHWFDCPEYHRAIEQAAFERGKQEGERLGLERAAQRVLESPYQFRDSLAADIRDLASTPSADWVMVEKKRLVELQTNCGCNEDNEPCANCNRIDDILGVKW